MAHQSDHNDDPITAAEMAALARAFESTGVSRRLLRLIIAVPGLARSMAESLRGDSRVPESVRPAVDPKGRRGRHMGNP